MSSTALQQALSACNFWAGLEYMNLPKVPDADEKRRVFKIDSDADLPWLNKARAQSLKGTDKRYKAQIAYCGLFNKRDFTHFLRTTLKAKAMAPSEMRKMEDTAVLLLPLDDTGRVCGEPFVSSLPWFVGRVQSYLTKPNNSANAPDLQGFDEYQEDLMRDLRALLVKLQLIPEELAKELAQQGGSKEEEAAAAQLRKGRVTGSANMKPLEVEHVLQLLQLIWTRAGWSPSWGPYVEGHGQEHLIRIKVVSMTPYIDRAVDLKTMNSMVANDVLRVRSELAGASGVGPALSRYLKLTPTPQRVDLRDENAAGGKGLFVSTLGVGKLPAGAWPDFPLVAAQQFAVNMSRQQLAKGGLYGVNGPPGTGKSTLLRDVIADQIVARAEAMAGYANPLTAFPRRGAIEGHRFGYWELDTALHGHGIVVASSNNGAVENVIKDLPKLTAPMKKAGVSYFSEASDSICAGPKEASRDVGATWGLVAALLGSGAKRRAFMSRFWFEAKPVPGVEPDPYRLRSLRGLIESNEHGAMEWPKAVKAFNEAKSRMQTRASGLQSYIDLTREATTLRHRIALESAKLVELTGLLESRLKLERALAAETSVATSRLAAYQLALVSHRQYLAAQQQHTSAQAAAAMRPAPSDAKKLLDEATQACESAARATNLVLARKIKWPESWFKWSENKEWRRQLKAATDAETAAETQLSVATRQSAEVATASANLSNAMAQLAVCANDLAKANDGLVALSIERPIDEQRGHRFVDDLAKIDGQRRQAHLNVLSTQSTIAVQIDLNKSLQAQLANCAAKLSAVSDQLGLISPEFATTSDLLQMEDHELQLSVPFNDATLRELRVEVFRCAMQINLSFVVSSWKSLSNSLSAFVDYQSGKITTAQLGDASPHLWNAFFMVVPVVSSTFASFDKLFSSLGREALGLLLIDEAGQSTPQNAVGAVWRSRRVIAVGDPLQLEPVVPQPVEAITAWRDWIGAENKWVPPSCSTQVLADDATPFGTELNISGIESRKAWVGSPLRVHRRCLSPMFDAANEIAYANLMVHGVEDTTGAQDWLGHSRWFDVHGDGDGHWIPSQGDFTMGLVKRLLDSKELAGELKNAKGEWHINVISPYKDVADEFSKLLRADFDDEPGIGNMAGTVHTFQGKEADVVILLLGGDPNKETAVSFFAGNEESPNLLNVALTRAKKRIYVVGDRRMWVENSGTFRRLDEMLEAHAASKATTTKSEVSQVC